MSKNRTITISFTTKEEGGKEQTLTMTVQDEFIPDWDMDQPNPVRSSMPRILEELRSREQEETPQPAVEIEDADAAEAWERGRKEIEKEMNEKDGRTVLPPPHAENSSADEG